MYKTYQTGGNFSLLDINALPDEEFEWLFGNVIEKNQAIAEYVAQRRPFRTVQDLKDCFYDYLFEMNSIEKISVVLRYPDFLENLVYLQEFSNTATNTTQDPEYQFITRRQREIMEEYNDLYKLKFAIPFVIHLQRGNKVETILAAMEERLTHATAHELNVTMEEICKICSKRIDSLVWPDV